MAPAISCPGKNPWWLSEYTARSNCHWRRLWRHTVAWAACLARDKPGNSKPARMAMTAMTTSNSMSVNAAGGRLC